MRTHRGADEESFQCIHELQDKQGHRGVALQPSVSKVAQKAFRRNLVRQGPLLLPWIEMVRACLFAGSWLPSCLAMAPHVLLLHATLFSNS